MIYNKNWYYFMKFIKKFESFVNNSGELEDFGDKKIYPSKVLDKFIVWFTEEFDEYMNKQGWTIFNIDANEITNDYVSSDGTVYQVQVVDFPEEFYNEDDDNALCGISTDVEAWTLAKKLNLILDDNGIIIGYDGELFI